MNTEWGRATVRGRVSRLTAALVVVFLAAGAGWGAEESDCPPSLRESIASMQATMEEEEEGIRTSTLEAQRGVEETVQFDLAAHACHRGPGQSYRVFTGHRCLEPDGAGRVPVRYSYELFFRKALTLEELFQKEWEQGSGGLHQVVFEPDGDRWVPAARKDVLDLRSKTPVPSGGHPGESPTR